MRGTSKGARGGRVGRGRLDIGDWGLGLRFKVGRVVGGSIGPDAGPDAGRGRSGRYRWTGLRLERRRPRRCRLYLWIEGMSREWREGGPKLGMSVVGWGDENWMCAV